MAKSGFVSLGFSSFGSPILMTRTPVASMQDLHRLRLWVWSEDEESGRLQDAALLGGLFDQQGMKRVPVSATLHDQFFSEARRDRDAVAAEVSSPELLNEVLGWLADYRALEPHRAR
jgi:hypothetical protein